MSTENTKNVAEYVQKSAALIDSLQNQVTALAAEKENLEKLAVQEKEASAPSTLDTEKVTKTVSALVKAGFVKEAEQELAVEKFTKDPSTVLNFLSKVAEREIEAADLAPLGRASDMSQSPVAGVRESDEVFERTFSNLATRI